jgi:hypothetical protein
LARSLRIPLCCAKLFTYKTFHIAEAAIARPKRRLTAIRELLDRDDACLDIVRYFVRHSEAADTTRGIADWWINRDVAQTAEALTRLREHGIVQSHLMQNVTSAHTFTKNPLLQEALRHYVLGRSSTRPAAWDLPRRAHPSSDYPHAGSR